MFLMFSSLFIPSSEASKHASASLALLWRYHVVETLDKIKSNPIENRNTLNSRHGHHLNVAVQTPWHHVSVGQCGSGLVTSCGYFLYPVIARVP